MIYIFTACTASCQQRYSCQSQVCIQKQNHDTPLMSNPLCEYFFIALVDLHGMNAFLYGVGYPVLLRPPFVHVNG